MPYKTKSFFSSSYFSASFSALAAFVLLLAGCSEKKAETHPTRSALFSGSAPHIAVEPSSLELGKGKQGKEIKGVIILQNRGGQTLEIGTITPSCGCTAAEMKSKEILPGKSAKLEISLDTRGKSGDVYKNILITSNDPAQPEFNVEVHAFVEAPLHGTFKIGDDLFSGSCKSCHYDRAGNKTGGRLYMAVCSFCHGMTGEGHKGSGPSLQTAMPENSLRYWIEKGKKGTAMAGFAKTEGGPLTEEQITSLVRFISQRFHTQP